MAALELICQPRMVDPEAIENRRLQIVDMNRIFHDVIAIIVGFAEGDAGLIPPPAIHTVKQRG